MKSNKAIKYRLYPTKKQEICLLRLSDVVERSIT